MIAVVLFMIMWQAAPEPHGSIVAKRSDPPRRDFYVISSDDAFLFAGRHYGSSSDPRGNSEPGLFVHSKQHGAWIQVTAIATSGGQFGTSISNDPEAQKRLSMAQTGWDFRSLAAVRYAGQPLKTASSIAFPETITYDVATDRYELRYMTSWGIPTAETILYIKRADLRAALGPDGHPGTPR